MRRARDAQVEVAARSRGAGAFAGDAHALVALHACRNLHVDLAATRPPASPAARWTRLALDVSGAMAGRARLLDVHRERFPGSVKCFVERDLDSRLHVAAAGALSALEEVLDSDTSASGPASPAHVAEDRAEEVGEVSGVPDVIPVPHSESAAGPAGGSLRIALPVGSERVVATTLLGIGQDFVGFVDLLEAVAGVLALRDVGVVLPGKPSVGGHHRPCVRP